MFQNTSSKFHVYLTILMKTYHSSFPGNTVCALISGKETTGSLLVQPNLYKKCEGISLPELNEYHYGHSTILLKHKYLYVMGGKASIDVRLGKALCEHTYWYNPRLRRFWATR